MEVCNAKKITLALEEDYVRILEFSSYLDHFETLYVIWRNPGHPTIHLPLSLSAPT